MRQRPRLKDIADRTGFSTNTVSLALQHSPLVAEGTRQTIWAAARQLKYRPNQLARSLVSRRSSTIGLILTNIRNPILTHAAQAIQSVLSEHGYATLFAASNHSIEQEKSAIDVFCSRQVDGMLIYPCNHSDLAHVAETRDDGTPIVLLSGGADAPVETVSFDARAGSRKAIEHLISLGHRRIGLLDNSAAIGQGEKAAGYEDALTAAGIPVDRGLMFDPAGFDAAHGYVAMERVMRQPDPPTAILASNDMLAVGALHWCLDRNIRVPEDLSVVGFDNTEVSAHATPPLATVNYPAEDLSRRAVQRLLSLITDDSDIREGEPLVEFIEPELVIRRSTGPVDGG